MRQKSVESLMILSIAMLMSIFANRLRRCWSFFQRSDTVASCYDRDN